MNCKCETEHYAGDVLDYLNNGTLVCKLCGERYKIRCPSMHKGHRIPDEEPWRRHNES